MIAVTFTIHGTLEGEDHRSIDLTGRKALVTGGAQGLGKKFAEFLTAAGATVAIGDLQDEKGKEVAAAVQGSYVHLDVTDDASWEAGVAQEIHVQIHRRPRHAPLPVRARAQLHAVPSQGPVPGRPSHPDGRAARR